MERQSFNKSGQTARKERSDLQNQNFFSPDDNQLTLTVKSLDVFNMPRAFLLKSKKFRSYRFQPVDPRDDEILPKITHDSRQRQRRLVNADRENTLHMKIEDEYSAENVSVEVDSFLKFPESSSQESFFQPHAGGSVSLQK